MFLGLRAHARGFCGEIGGIDNSGKFPGFVLFFGGGKYKAGRKIFVGGKEGV